VSSHDSDFNRDYGVSFSAEELRKPVFFNYAMRTLAAAEDEWPGISVFCKDESGAVFHSYSCYLRGIDMVNGAYQFLDLVPKGRDEDGFDFSMKWLRRHDEYDER
jgi:predicted dithiol-disulfide oxidoreductase (DUF899 family)